MKTFFKTVLRMFKSNFGRFIANTLMIFLTATISIGLASVVPTTTTSLQSSLKANNISDIIIKCTSDSGFTNEQIEIVTSLDGITASKSYFVYDFRTTYEDESTGEKKNGITRFYQLDFEDQSVNSLTLIEGRYPQASNECVILSPTKNLTSYGVYDNIYINSIYYLIVGIVEDPLYISVGQEPSYLTDDNGDYEYLTSVCYTSSAYSSSVIPITYPTTDLVVCIDKEGTNYFTTAYTSLVDEKEAEIIELLGKDNVATLTLEDNVGYVLFKSYSDKITMIALIFPVFFIIVSFLVILITLTRLVMDERSLIGCYTSIGIPKNKILLKYVLFTFAFAFIGSFAGFLVGGYLIPPLIYTAYAATYNMPGIIIQIDIGFGMILSLIILLISLGIITYLILRCLAEQPSQLLTYKAPKPGKKILLERIKPIWSKLSFRYKSSLRNIFRGKKNFILTILAILGSSLLVFIGFALLDNSIYLANDPLFGNLISSISLISVVIVLFAIGMCTLIIYNINNMNIQERKRELATLKVLGYQDIECSFYTFREILIMSIIGAILAIPFSYYIVKYVFIYLDFGSISNVQWYSYILPFIFVILTTILVNFLLYPKVKNVDMNDSLKTLE